MKLHLGCGNVYLEGWVNIDLHIEGYSFLASERPDLVERNRTTIDKYYKEPYSRDSIRHDALCVADRFMDILNLKYVGNSAEEILVVQTFEHFSRSESRKALWEWHRMLRPGGVLTIDVPDFEGLCKLLLTAKSEQDKEYYYRMIFGSHKNEYAFHKDGYSFNKLYTLLQTSGYVEIVYVGNIFHHPYPSITLKAIKLEHFFRSEAHKAL